MTEREIIQKFVDAAQVHPSVVWSDVGRSDFLFDSQRNIQFPCFFVQPTGATSGDLTLTLNYTLYCLDLPSNEIEVDNQAFAWDTAMVDSRDKTKQILEDIVKKVTLENQQDFRIETSSIVQDNSQLDGAIGYRVSITIETQEFYNLSNFPS